MLNKEANDKLYKIIKIKPKINSNNLIYKTGDKKVWHICF